MASWIDTLITIVRLVLIAIAFYYLYQVMFPPLSDVDGAPSEKRSIPVSEVRKYYIKRYVDQASHGPTSALLRKYVKEIYDYTPRFTLFDADATDDGTSDNDFRDDEKNRRLLEYLKSSEYQRVLKLNESCRQLYNQLTCVYDPRLDNTMFNRFLMKRPQIVYRQPEKFRVDYT